MQKLNVFKWMMDDGLFDSSIKAGYSNLEAGVMGRTVFGYPCYCLVSHVYMEHPILTKCILWHEYSHAWLYLTSGKIGHGWAFWRKLWSKPWYAIVPFVAILYCAYLEAKID